MFYIILQNTAVTLYMCLLTTLKFCELIDQRCMSINYLKYSITRSDPYQKLISMYAYTVYIHITYNINRLYTDLVGRDDNEIE